MKKLVLPLIIVGMVLMVVIGVYVEESKCIQTVQVSVSANGVDQSVSLFKNNGRWYAFLPSYTDPNHIKIQSNSGYEIWLNDTLCNAIDISCEMGADKEHRLTIKNALGFTVAEEALVIMKSGNIPAISIDILDGTINDIHKDKKNKKSGTITVINADSEIDFMGSIAEFGGRGNTTWGQVKKPYFLGFSTDVNLLNMGGQKKYNLLANACDESNLRNKLALDLAKKANVSGALDSCYVDLYIDNQYYGLYLLTDGIIVGEAAIDIDNLEERTQRQSQYPLSKFERFEKTEDGVYQKGFKIPVNPEDITGGYLLELEFAERFEFCDSGFITKDDVHFYVRSPKYCSEEQIQYISSLFQNIEDSLATDAISQYIDMDSWARYYLVQEILANSDIGSFYFYKDNNTVDASIKAGPVWDLDFSLGSGFMWKDLNPAVFYIGTSGWFQELRENETFNQYIEELYETEFREYLKEIIETELNELVDEIQDSYFMNQQRWNGIQNYIWTYHFESLQEHYDQIEMFLKQRLNYLDEALVGGQKFYRLGFRTNEGTMERLFYSVQPGEVFGEAPVLEYEGYRLIGYFDGEEQYDPCVPITENKIYTAKWEPLEATQQSTATETISFMGLARKVLRNVYYNFSMYFIGGLFILMLLIVIICLWRDFRKGGANRGG